MSLVCNVRKDPVFLWELGILGLSLLDPFTAVVGGYKSKFFSHSCLRKWLELLFLL